MKKLLAILMCMVILLSFVGCTANSAAKNFGGTMTIELPANEKLVNATWKDDELWYLTREMRQDEFPATATFQEKSSYGVFEGKVIFKESKK